MRKKVIILALGVLIAVAVGCGAVYNSSKQTTMGHVKQLTKAEFIRQIANYEGPSSEWKYLGSKPAIVDFYAHWCGPCQALAPVLQEIAAEYKGRIEVYKVDVDKQAELASDFDIRSIPSLLFIPMTGEPEMTRGVMNAEQLRRHIESVLLRRDTVTR